MRILLIPTLLLTCAFGSCQTKPSIPPAPEIIKVPVKVYVTIDPRLTKPLPIATGSLKEIPAVSRKRRLQLEQCNIDRAEVAKVQGTAVPDEPPKAED